MNMQKGSMSELIREIRSMSQEISDLRIQPRLQAMNQSYDALEKEVMQERAKAEASNASLTAELSKATSEQNELIDTWRSAYHNRSRDYESLSFINRGHVDKLVKIDAENLRLIEENKKLRSKNADLQDQIDHKIHLIESQNRGIDNWIASYRKMQDEREAINSLRCDALNENDRLRKRMSKLESLLLDADIIVPPEPLIGTQKTCAAQPDELLGRPETTSEKPIDSYEVLLENARLADLERGIVWQTDDEIDKTDLIARILDLRDKLTRVELSEWTKKTTAELENAERWLAEYRTRDNKQLEKMVVLADQKAALKKRVAELEAALAMRAEVSDPASASTSDVASIEPLDVRSFKDGELIF